MKQQFRVMGYNLHSGLDRTGTPSLDRELALVREFKPDLLGLEEVALRHAKTPDLVTHEEAGRVLGMHACFGKALDIAPEKRWEYGVAALSRAPMELAGKIFLPVPGKSEPRVFLVVRVMTERPVYFIVTHFSYQGEFENSQEYRMASARKITEEVKKNNWFPAILTGDLNTLPDSEVIRILREDWDIWNDLDRETSSVSGPKDKVCQIDYIATYPKGAFRAKEFGFTDDLAASDHKPVHAVLELLDE